ncbi:unnamed protein product [Polarella glacialis]|uniref:RNA helicase n=1 Tax=Polarella glacialis TaxID=89957 RepID=A0A813GFG9_POLGL|nr:unnamed protein product [Polarella glacialis]|eukprot:CAMPEP_0115077164 /NCGR_PEP_ID=MMETSP0227-20121206/16835_1 /TAXON_ID=89957 /ORGANISM="Polarella glacialis, Strain CCMP 1383" /LENGTH=1025 /DNA_ID=CAMNT_0002464395 /DNA_START=98 /DNA_END=3175 /DNA_ORIENTATION=+
MASGGGPLVALHRWVEGEMHGMLGMAAAPIVAMVLDIASNCKSGPDLQKELEKTNFPKGDKLEDFCKNLVDKLAPIGRPAAKRSGGAASSSSAPPPGKKQKGEESVKAEPEVPLTKEELRERDTRERDELNERIKQRDSERTKKVGPGTIGADQEKESKSFEFSNDDERREAIEHIRMTARRKYLGEREVKIADLRSRQVADAEWLLKGEKLSSAEEQYIKLERQLYDVAKQRMGERGVEKQDGYAMPDEYDEMAETKVGQSKRFSVLEQRYEKTYDEKWEANEQQQLEDATVKRGVARYGAQKGREEKTQYQLILDDAVEFCDPEVVGGNFKAEPFAEEKHSDSEDEKDMNVAKGVRDDRAAKKMERESQKLQACRKSLPVYLYKAQLLEAIRDYQVLIVVGETGSGKTTQIPQYLHEVGYSKIGKIGCTQPRRVAAMSVAARVSQEVGCKLGHDVGYNIRFEDCTTDRTVIEYMTDGMLLRSFLNEPDMQSYSVMIIDEAHERTLHTDILFGLVKDVARFRQDLKVIISSATLDAEKFSEYFDNAPIFNVPGRRYPVSIHYTKAPEANYLDACVITVLQIHLTQGPGDVLVFFTGQQEIEEAIDLISYKTRGLGASVAELLVLPIYATLPTDLQAKIFEPTPEGARKIVLATNIAETSITIDNIVFVIDPGFCKQNTFNPRTGMESLVVVPCSKASANQRAGRAGRVKPGKCFRLFTKWSFEHELDDDNAPEIQRSNLGHVVLMLKSIGIDDLLHFDFMDPPPPETLIKALEQLYALSALNDQGDLTKMGRRMAEFPMDPMMSKVLIAAEKYKVVNEILTVCGMLGVDNAIFYRPKDKGLHADNARKNFHRAGGDHMTSLHVYNQWEETGFSLNWCMENYLQNRSLKRARDIREQLVDMLDKVEIEHSSDPQNLDGQLKAILSGYFYNTARLRKDGSYVTVKHPHTVEIHPTSSLFGQQPKLVCYHELCLTTKEYMRGVIEIKPEWLLEVAPHFYQSKDLDGFKGKMPKGQGAASGRNAVADL